MAVMLTSKAFDEEPQLQPDDGQTITAPSVYVLDDLLDQVTPDNRPDEWAMGPAVGNEVW